MRWKTSLIWKRSKVALAYFISYHAHFYMWITTEAGSLGRVAEPDHNHSRASVDHHEEVDNDRHSHPGRSRLDLEEVVAEMEVLMVDQLAVHQVLDRTMERKLSWVDNHLDHKLLEVDSQLNWGTLSIEDLAVVDRSAVMLAPSLDKDWR